MSAINKIKKAMFKIVATNYENPINSERKEAIELFGRMREKTTTSGDFMTDDEINDEIRIARAERKARKAGI